MQGATEHLGTAEEHTRLGGAVDLAYTLEDHVPVGTAEVGWGAQAGDGVLLGVGVIDHDVGCVVSLDLGCEILSEVLALVL